MIMWLNYYMIIFCKNMRSKIMKLNINIQETFISVTGFAIF